MTYISLYRKWRPQTFSEIIGQDHITRTLQNAIQMGRIGHAYLFSGPRGTGKTTVAKLLAKALNCVNGPIPEPCDQCENCRQIREGVSLDVAEIDGASNRGIDEIRDLREKVRFVPSQGRYKVYIIDEVHMLTTEAFNALLKTLEEPPQHVIFIFATTEPHKVPATIISRCQSFEFHRIALPDLLERLEQVSQAEGLKASTAALNLIARNAQGGLRDALSILDQCIAYAGNEITVEDVKELLGVVEFELLAKYTEAIQKGNLVEALTIIDEVLSLGKDLTQFCSALLDYWRNLMIYQATGQGVAEYTESEQTCISEQARIFTLSQITQLISVLGETLPDVRRYQSKLPLELATVKACNLTGSEHQSGGSIEEKPVKSEDKPEPKPKLRDKVEEPVTRPVEATQVDKWSEFLDFLKSKRLVSLQALLRDVTPALAGDKLWLTLKAELTFHRDNLNKEKNREKLQEALQEFYGRQIQVEAVCGDVPAKAVTKPKDQNSEKLVDDPVVKKAIELFGASVVKIEENQ